MKSILLFLFSFSLSVFSFGQSGNWQWSRCQGGVGSGEGLSVSANTQGNIFVSGAFWTWMTMGTTTLTCSGLSDMFVAKYDIAGNIQWAKSAGGPDWEEGYVCADLNGGVFVFGDFASKVFVVDTITLTNADTAAGNSRDIYIAKYNSNGDILWAKSFGGIGSDAGYSVSVDPKGNIFLTGEFSSPVIVFGFDTLTNTGAYDAFVAKCDPNGNVLWAKNPKGRVGERGTFVSADASGNVFATGWFASDTIIFVSDTLTNTGGSDLYITKYDSTGSLLWAKSAGGTAGDYANGVSVDANGNVFVTGRSLSGNIAFDTDTITTSGFFLSKYDKNGNILWAKGSTGGSSIGYSVKADANGDVFVTAGFNNASPTIILNTDTLSVPSGNPDPMFLAKYSATGNIICADALTSGGDDMCAVTVDHSGNAYIVGDFMNYKFYVGQDTLTRTGPESFFISKYSCGNITGMNEPSTSEKIIVYPNPSADKFNLTMSQFEDLKIKEIKIYSVYGEKIYDNSNYQIGTSSNFQIDLSSQSNGIYFLKAEGKEGSYSAKIIKQ